MNRKYESETAKIKRINSRNLHIWSQWRTEVNQSMIQDMITGRGTYTPPLEDVISAPSPFDGRDRQARLENPVSLMAYSSGPDNVTDLNPDEFLSYGIPRVNPDNVRTSGLPDKQKPALREPEFASRKVEPQYRSPNLAQRSPPSDYHQQQYSRR